MPERGLQELFALHEQLATLDEAGVRMDLGIPAGQVRDRITKLDQEIAGRVGRGESLEAALRAKEGPTTPAYQRLVLAWLAGGEIESLLQNARGDKRFPTEQRRLNAGLVYPIAVAIAACGGLAAMVCFVLPHVEAAYADLDEPVGMGIARLQAIRGAMPFWLVLTPMILIGAAIALRRATPPRVTSTSRETGVAARTRLANATGNAGDLMDAGVAATDALSLAGLPTPHAKQPRLPALAEWVSTSAKETTVSAEDLHAISTLYDGMARQGARRFATLVPLIACIVVGGGATLLYALALFVPVIELLWTLAI